MKEREKDVKELENQQMTSLVWIVLAGHNCSELNVVDASCPGDVLDTFYVCSSRVLCIASVPGEHRDTCGMLRSLLTALRGAGLAVTLIQSGTTKRDCHC